MTLIAAYAASILLVLPIFSAALSNNFGSPVEGGSEIDGTARHDGSSFGQVDLPLGGGNDYEQNIWGPGYVDSQMYSQPTSHQQDLYGGYTQTSSSRPHDFHQQHFQVPYEQMESIGHPQLQAYYSGQGSSDMGHSLPYSRHDANYAPFEYGQDASAFGNSGMHRDNMMIGLATSSTRMGHHQEGSGGSSSGRNSDDPPTGGDHFPQQRAQTAGAYSEEGEEGEEDQEGGGGGGGERGVEAKQLVSSHKDQLMFRQWLRQEWKNRGMDFSMPAQTLARKVAEIKISYPDQAANTGHVSFNFVEKAKSDDDEYLFDFHAWSTTYRMRIAYLRKTLEVKGYHGEQLTQALLDNYQDVNCKHHATLADPVLEAKEVAKSRQIWNEFYRLKVQSRMEAGEQLSMDLLAEESWDYAGTRCTHLQAMKYLNKYLTKVQGWRPIDISKLKVKQDVERARKAPSTFRRRPK